MPIIPTDIFPISCSASINERPSETDLIAGYHRRQVQGYIVFPTLLPLALASDLRHQWPLPRLNNSSQMKNFEAALFCVLIGCLVRLNEAWEASNWDRDAVQEEIPLDPERSIVGNTDFDPEYEDVKSRDPLIRGPNQFSSRVRREESEIDYSECGVIEENPKLESESGYITDVWPWMVAVLDKKKVPFNEEILCGGSVINKRFVMTSATCVTFSRKIRKKNEISVVLGLGNRRRDEEPEQFDVKAIYVSPDFDNSEPYHNYDYDIALLELEKPIVYSRYIRPVCLPTGDSNLYNPQSLTLGLGFGTTDLRRRASTLTRNTLKEVKLVIQQPDVCKENLEKAQRNLKKMYFTQRMFCAVEESPYLCYGDGGGPVMQPEVREDGRRIWTQVGIISFGKGCGKDALGYYTYIYKLLPWIQGKANE